MLRLRTAAAVALCVTALPALGEAQYTRTLQHHHQRRDHLHRQLAWASMAHSQNGQGTRGSIGTFITTNTALQDVTPPRRCPAVSSGHDRDWRQNSAAAELRLPAGRPRPARRAGLGRELGLRWRERQRVPQQSVALTTPAGTFDGDARRDHGQDHRSATATGNCQPGPSCFYIRSANVTALSQQAGFYTVAGVPATQGTSEQQQPRRLDAGGRLRRLQPADPQPGALSRPGAIGRCGRVSVTASARRRPGPVSARLAVSAIEGDARLTNDQMLFGPTRTRPGQPRGRAAQSADQLLLGSDFERLRQPRHRGTFGDRNHTPGTPVDGARQGWDITNVDVSAQLATTRRQRSRRARPTAMATASWRWGCRSTSARRDSPATSRRWIAPPRCSASS